MFFLQIKRGLGQWEDFDKENPFETFEGMAKAYWYWRAKTPVGHSLRGIERSAVLGDIPYAPHKLLDYRK